MPTFNQLTQGMSRAWDSLTDGWHHLRERTAHALTRFNPVHREDSHPIEQQTARWGLLAAELRERDRGIEVRMEAPGMERGDFDISVVDDYLIVRGEKRMQREGDRSRYHILECAYGRFERAIPLPAEVDQTRAKAKYNKGVLTISLPKYQDQPQRRIEVKVD